MGFYSYEVVDRSGAMVSGRIEADNEAIAVERLRNMGLTVVNLSEVRPSPFAGLQQLSQKKVEKGELAVFSRQLETMLNAGIPLTRALHTLGEQISHPTFKETVKSLARNVEGGLGFAEAMRAYPTVFPALYVDMISAGETSGSLVEVLNRLATQLEQEKALHDQIKSATTYPIVVGCLALAVLLVMLVFVVPIFVKFFPANLELPVMTRVIIGLSTSVRLYWYVWLLVIAGIVLGVRFYIGSGAGQKQWDSIKYKIPVFGPLAHKAMIARFCRTLSTMLESGIPILNALASAGPTSGSSLVKEAIDRAAQKVQEGQSISVPLEESGWFPPLVVQMVAVGEETGALPFMLNKVAEFYEQEVASMTKGLASLLEPIMIMVVGGVVALIVISIYLPMFTVVTNYTGS